MLTAATESRRSACRSVRRGATLRRAHWRNKNDVAGERVAFPRVADRVAFARLAAEASTSASRFVGASSSTFKASIEDRTPRRARAKHWAVPLIRAPSRWVPSSPTSVLGESSWWPPRRELIAQFASLSDLPRKRPRAGLTLGSSPRFSFFRRGARCVPSTRSSITGSPFAVSKVISARFTLDDDGPLRLRVMPRSDLYARLLRWIALYRVVDPFAAVPIFLALAGGQPRSEGPERGSAPYARRLSCLRRALGVAPDRGLVSSSFGSLPAPRSR